MELMSNRMALCCGALEIGHFGGGETVHTLEHQLPKDEIERAVKEKIKTARGRGFSIVFATTMCNQPNAAAALKELGFHGTDPAPMTYNSDRKIQGWILPLNEKKV